MLFEKRLLKAALALSLASLCGCGGGGGASASPAGNTLSGGSSAVLSVSGLSNGASTGRVVFSLSGTCSGSDPVSATGTNINISNASCSGGVLSVNFTYTGTIEGTGSASLSVTQGSQNSVINWTHTNPCPTNFIWVKGNATYGTSDFCVARYHTSPAMTVVPGTTPHVNVTQVQALANCPSMNAAYRLMSNAEWQTMARDAETVAGNWSTGVPGTGVFVRGQSTWGAGVQATGADDSDPCINTAAGGATNCPGVTTAYNAARRTVYLTTGSSIWDINGNATNWMSDTYSNPNQATMNNVWIYNYDDSTADQWKTNFGSGYTYTAGSDNVNGYGLGGFIYAATGGAILRGSWDSGANASYGGLYGVRFAANSSSSTARSYRCTTSPSY